MEEKKEMTVEELWDKLHEERRMWRDRLEKAEREKKEGVAAVRHVADLVIARFVRSYGVEDGDEIRVDIPKPRNRDGFFWATRTEELDADTWRIYAKEIELPK